MLEYEFIYQLLEKFKIKLFYTFCSIIRELKKPRSWEKTLRTKRTQEKKGVLFLQSGSWCLDGKTGQGRSSSILYYGYVHFGFN